MNHLSIREQHQVQDQTAKLIRTGLDRNQPQLELYLTGQTQITRLVKTVLVSARLFLLVIAIFAGLASSIRTVQAASEIYSAAGSHPIGVVLAAIAFTIAVEGALFILALAQESEQLKHRANGARRRVTSLKTIWHGIQVRIGLRDPLDYSELPEGGGFGLVIFIAAAFAVIANAFMGFRPILNAIGNVSLQEFFTNLWSAPAQLQLTFLLDLAGILFPPLMAFAAGHLMARFAAEIAQESQAGKLAYEHDMELWRQAYANPLETEEGKQLLERMTQERLQTKAEKKARQENASADFLALAAHLNGDRPHSEMG